MAPRALLALLFALLPFLGGWPGTSLGGGGTGGGTGGGGGGGGASATLNDDFAADATGWSNSIGDWCRKKSGAGTLEHAGPGLCLYNNGTGNAGTVPTSDAQWMVAQYAVAFADTGFHMKDVAAGTGNSIGVTWGTGGTASIGTCDTGYTCGLYSHAAAAPGTPAAGDQLGVVVKGSGATAETCVWFWRAADADPSNWSDPTTWGNADACQVQGGTLSQLTAYANCGGGTACYNESMDYVPADGQTYVGFISITTNNVEWEWVLAGNL